MSKCIIMLFVWAIAGGTASVQTTKELAKERKEVAKLSTSELNARATKAAREEAKRPAEQPVRMNEKVITTLNLRLS